MTPVANGGLPRRWAVLAAFLACLVMAALLLREPLGRWLFPDAAVAGLLAQAEQALAAGDAASAATRFWAAQARNPDHTRVAEGLAATRERVLIQAEAALAGGAVDEARTLIALAAALGAPGHRLATLRRGVEERAEPAIEALLQRALDAEDRDPTAALGDYLQVLARDPGNRVALAGRGRLLAALLSKAEAALTHGDIEQASVLVQRVQSIDPAHLHLPVLAERLGALPAPASPGRSPVAVTSPEAARWLGLAEEALGRGALDQARLALDRARGLEPTAPQLAVLELRWQRAQGTVEPQP